MISKREFFEMCPDASEEDYKVFQKQMSDITEKIWEENHPLDYQCDIERGNEKGYVSPEKIEIGFYEEYSREKWDEMERYLEYARVISY